MLRSAAVFATTLSVVAAFAPSAIPTRAAARSAISMQLWEDGKVQGRGVRAIPFSAPPASLPENIPGFVGFDPFGISTLVDIKYLQESEIKHGRAAMLAAAGSIVQDVFTFPGVDKVIGNAKLIGAHDAFINAVHSGNKKAFAMHQIFFWVGFIELITAPAIAETLSGSARKPGDFSFDPLGLGKGNDRARLELAEIKNGRLAMIGIGGIVHHYLLTGKGPVQFLTGIPNYKSCIDPHLALGLCK